MGAHAAALHIGDADIFFRVWPGEFEHHATCRAEKNVGTRAVGTPARRNHLFIDRAHEQPGSFAGVRFLSETPHHILNMVGSDDGLAWFKTAFGAFVYDKGYRQAFSMLGFPGPDSEYLMALSQLGSARRELDEADAAILDVSCGPGMFAPLVFAAHQGPHQGSSSR